VDWVELAQDSSQRRAVVNTVMILQRERNFWAIRVTASFSRRNLLRFWLDNSFLMKFLANFMYLPVSVSPNSID
jgi:hypothetical protein